MLEVRVRVDVTSSQPKCSTVDRVLLSLLVGDNAETVSIYCDVHSVLHQNCVCLRRMGIIMRAPVAVLSIVNDPAAADC